MKTRKLQMNDEAAREERAKCIAIIEALKEEYMEDFDGTEKKAFYVYEFHRGKIVALSEVIDAFEDEETNT